MEVIENQPLSLNEIDKLLELPPEIQTVYEERKRKSYVGAFDVIERKFHQLPIATGWSTYAKALREQGAIVAVSYKLPMVNTDVIPPNLVAFVREHEAVECALDTAPPNISNNFAVSRAKELGLKYNEAMGNVRWNHVFATFRQMRLAQQEGMLDEMMRFADELENRPENIRNALGNNELRHSIYEMLTTAA